MLNNYLYYKTDSYMHTLNPILKFFLVLFFIIATILSSSTISHIFLIAFLIIIIYSTKIPLIKYLKVILFISGILLITFIIDLLIFRSIIQTITILVSFTSIVLMIYILFATTNITDLMMLFETLLYPLKIFGLNPQKMAFKIVSNMTFINVMYEENKILRKALKNHNKDAKITFNNSFFSRTDYLEELVYESKKRMDLYNNCMEVKNYGNESNKIYKLYVRRIDYAVISVQILLLIAIIVKG